MWWRLTLFVVDHQRIRENDKIYWKHCLSYDINSRTKLIERHNIIDELPSFWKVRGTIREETVVILACAWYWFFVLFWMGSNITTHYLFSSQLFFLVIDLSFRCSEILNSELCFFGVSIHQSKMSNYCTLYSNKKHWTRRPRHFATTRFLSDGPSIQQMS